ncbi:hypothetical protein OAP63_12135 [Vibrio sp.]|nr:hypothetical protein [Vibrio sp.]
MKDLFITFEEIEEREEKLRHDVGELSPEKRKHYYHVVSMQLKDPDTYATLAWSSVGGFHHLYLQRYIQFLVEIVLVITCIVLMICGITLAIWGIVALAIFELPQLFYSQKIARLYNYRLSKSIFEDLSK